MQCQTLIVWTMLAISGVSYAQASKEQAVAEETAVQKTFVIKNYFAQMLRIERVAYPLLRVASPYCSDKRRRSVAISPINIAVIASEFKSAAQQVGVDEHPEFFYIPEESPLARAGAQVGDKIIAVNGLRPPDPTVAVSWFDQIVHQLALKSGSVTLSVLRGGQEANMQVTPQWICNLPLRVSINDAVNASAGMDGLAVTSGMNRFAENDNELALVLGHEIAHAVLRHSEQSVNSAKQASGILGVLFGRTLPQNEVAQYAKDKERDADYLGLYLAMAAGFDVKEAPNFWRRMAANHPGAITDSFGSTHPSTPERAVNLQMTLQEINDLQVAGKPLLPNLARLKTAYDGEYVYFEGGRKVRKPLSEDVATGKKLPSFNEVPFLSNEGRILYQKFLALKTRPRAFALSEGGASAYRKGANAAADALASCNSGSHSRQPCKLYVLNDDLVYGSTDTAAAPQEIHPNSAKTDATTAVPPVAHPVDRYPATGFAQIGDVGAVPLVSEACRKVYAGWLSKREPRAFAIDKQGHCSFSWGLIAPTPGDSTIPAERVKEVCGRKGWDCLLYAVDSRVVFSPEVK